MLFIPNPLIYATVALITVSMLIQMAYGTKAHQQKLAAEKHGEATKRDLIGKILHPGEYPVESSAAWATAANATMLAYGIRETLYSKETAFTIIAMSVLAIFSYTHMLLGKEKTKDGSESPKTEYDQSTKEAIVKAAEAQNMPAEWVFSKSESKPVGLYGRAKEYLKGRPVLAGSLIMVGTCLFGIIGNLIEGKKLIAGAVALVLAGNLIRALLVTKKDFNIEGAQEEVKNPATGVEKPVSFRERVTNKRGNNDLGIQPA